MRAVRPWLSHAAVVSLFATAMAVAGCAAGGSTETEIPDDGFDAGLDGSAGSGGQGSDEDASIDSGSGDSATDAADEVGTGDAGDAGDAAASGDAGPGDGGEDAEPPKGSLELCVLNTGGPLDPCEIPEQLDFGVVAAGTQEKRLFRLDNETFQNVTFETAYVSAPEFSVAAVQFVPDIDDPSIIAREVVNLPQGRIPGTALYFEVTFTSKGETAGPVPADTVYVTATTASSEIIDVEVPIVGTQEACDEGFAACDADPNNGCDTNIKESIEHCGVCGTQCAYANGTAACDDGVCKLTACTGNFADCNADPSDGCEANLKTDSLHCGTCDNACDLANADSACSGGSCVIVQCRDDFRNCDNDPATGCEADISSDLRSCGACNQKCDYANASERCQGGNCIFESCNAGYANCNGDLADGCETHTNSDLANCGGCNQLCDFPNASESCQAGVCKFGACNTGWADCNGDRGSYPSDGCETNVRTDSLNCGVCGNECSFPNGVGACVNGTCQLVDCAPGYKDCDGNPANGCETNINSNLGHCGDCNKKCDYANASETCQNQQCIFEGCAPGFGNCNGDLADGCEKNLLTDSANCGTCGNVCPGGRVCMEGQCRIPCGSGLIECNDACRDISNDRDHCGGCNIKCNDNQTCTGGACQNCPSGQLQCGSFCVNATSNACDAPISAGTLGAAGNTYTSTQRYLRGVGQVEWFKADFPINASPRQRGTGSPKVEFVFNENNVFQIDVFSNCGTTPFACGNESGSSTSKTGFTFVDNYSDTGQGFTKRNVDWPSTMYVRVKRIGGTGCERYQIRISR